VTAHEREILRMLACRHANTRGNDMLPPDLLECVDCGGIVSSVPPPRWNVPPPSPKQRLDALRARRIELRERMQLDRLELERIGAEIRELEAGE
jgi:hypothetical protein